MPNVITGSLPPSIAPALERNDSEFLAVAALTCSTRCYHEADQGCELALLPALSLLRLQ